MMRPAIPPVLLLLLALAPSGAVGQEVRCDCPDGQACYHYLHAPVVPPEDPCHCAACREKPGTCSARLPDGWDPVCAGNDRMECFLRRHAASWKLACSEQLAGTCDCRNPHPEWCPKCGKNGEPWNGEDLEIVRRQMEVERRLLGDRRKLIIVKSPHFYLVTDVRRLKVRTQERNGRMMDMHEIAHLFIQRAEIAYEDFVAVFGEPILPRPAGIYFLDREDTKELVAERYIGLPEPELCYGGNYDSIGGGYPYNCSVFSAQKYKHDKDCHHQMRHLVAHQLFSCWKVVGGSNDILPRWVYAGVAHWLSRLPPLLSDTANFCTGEGAEVRDDGDEWPEMVLRDAMNPRQLAVEQLFGANTLGALTLDMHVRAWSYFDVFLKDDPERFVAFLAKLREGKDHRTALAETFSCSPAEFDRRWRERVLGKRDSAAPTAAELDAADPSRPGAAERDAIRNETDPEVLAAKVRALHAVNDVLTARTLLPLLGHESELVRGTAMIVLSRTTSPEVRQWLRTDAAERATGMARAVVARILGNVGDPEAGAALLAIARDGYWLARAHAAVALGKIGHEPAIPTLAGLVDDRAPGTRVAAMDGLASFGRRAAAHGSTVADHLGDASWQSRSAAAECLGALGEMAFVDALIDRMEIESGRVRLDIRAALKKITHDDLGNDPKYWREWWEREKARAGGLPARPEPPAERPDDRYAEPPTAYGIRIFSQSIGYVIDTSSSMAYSIEIDPGWLKRQSRKYAPSGSKYDYARNEIRASLESLDPRVRLNVWFFRSTASSFKRDLVPATPSNVESALGRIDGESPRADLKDTNRRTNYIDVLRMIFDAKKGEPPAPGFADTPDTLLFLTDGKPTEGDITEPDVLLDWISERNRFARMRIHVITFGSREARTDFLAAFARQNGGTFVQVPENRK